MSRTSRALHRARQLIDSMQGREWTKDVFKGSEFNSGDYCCITKNIAILLKNKEVVGKKKMGKKITVFHYTAIKFPLCTEDLPEPIRFEKKVSSKKEWVFRDWFPIPEFKVNSVYRHDGGVK